MTVDPRLVAAVREQLARRPDGAARVGWKVGAGSGERIGVEPVAVGSLTTATLLEPGATYRGGGGDLRADAEVAVEVGPDGAAVRYGVALELCDLADRAAPEDVVAANVYHRAVVFGPLTDSVPEALEVVVDGETRGAAPVEEDPSVRLGQVARVLAAVGERLEDGDRVITGSVVQVPIGRGDEVVADAGPLGRIGVVVA
jgi:2-keto-4-pentenoate hydratase